jgi:hypothetical protein
MVPRIRSLSVSGAINRRIQIGNDPKVAKDFLTALRRGQQKREHQA